MNLIIDLYLARVKTDPNHVHIEERMAPVSIKWAIYQPKQIESTKKGGGRRWMYI